MKRKLIAFTTSVLLLTSMLLASSVNAHLVTLVDPNTMLYDKSRAEWFGTSNGEPPDAGTGMIQRDAANRGEFVFNDAVEKKVLDPNPNNNEHRVITGTAELTKSTDLDWFAITGGPSNDAIYFLAKMDSIKSTTANPVPEVMVSIDTASGGNTALPDGVGVNVNAAAAWEQVIQTDFTTTANTGNTRPPKRWTGPATTAACTGCQAQLVSSSPGGGQAGSFIEIKVPWSNIGGKPPLGQSLRFTATVYRKGHAHPNDGFTSALIDAASTKKTIDILKAPDNGTVNTYFDLHFDANGEVFSPLLISEFLPNPVGSDDSTPDHTEWIEIYNTLPASCGAACNVSLNGYKLGDAARKGGTTEGMLQFPSGKTLAPGGLAIVARLTNKIVGVTGSPLLIKQSDMSPYLAWAGGSTVGLDNPREQILLLNASDTIVDLVEYTTAGNPNAPFINSTPLVFPAGAPESDTISYERCPATNDSNNTASDFLTHDGGPNGNPSPGVPCPAATGVDLTIHKVASASQLLAGSTFTYNIVWSNLGGNLTSVVVSDTLPVEISYMNQSSSSGVFTPSAGPGQPMFWTFTFPGTTTNVSGTITLTARIKSDAPVNRPLVNTAEVREQDPGRIEDPSKLANNTSSAEVTAIRPDLAVSTNWPGAGQANANVDFTINYNNHGEGEANSVIISDTLPANVTFLSSSPAPDPSSTATRKVWKIPTLAPGATGSILVHVKINAAVAGDTPLDNSVVITGEPPDAPGTTTDNTETKRLTVGKFKILLPLVKKP
jgi:uncharacterized repeat protein (TIGR01451 family)